MKRGPPRNDLAGRRFGKWTAILSVERRYNTYFWLAKCDCGTERVVQGRHLTSGRSSSCGCARSGPQHPRFKHGKSGTPEYGIWLSMLNRCENSAHSEYSRYGGRGISVCAAWRSDFAAFLHDMGPRPSAFHSIDRANNDGNYEPSNCRWATPKEQGNNTRRNRFLTVRGERMTMRQAADRFGVNYTTLKYRIYKGQPPEVALRVDD